MNKVYTTTILIMCTKQVISIIVEPKQYLSSISVSLMVSLSSKNYFFHLFDDHTQG